MVRRSTGCPVLALLLPAVLVLSIKLPPMFPVASCMQHSALTCLPAAWVLAAHCPNVKDLFDNKSCALQKDNLAWQMRPLKMMYKKASINTQVLQCRGTR